MGKDAPESLQIRSQPPFHDICSGFPQTITKQLIYPKADTYMKSPGKHLFKCATVVSGLLAASPLSAATLIHSYQFQNNLNDSLSGPALVSGGGTVTSGGYTFAAGQGLSLSNWTSVGSDAGNYTFDIIFRFTGLSGGAYSKILDSKGQTSDNGLYRENESLIWYQGGGGGADSIQVNQDVRVHLTRDGGTKLVIGYINLVEQFRFTDTGDDAVFDAANNIIHLFKDDGRSDEEAPGRITQFQIYSGPLTSGEIAAIPEPTGLALLSLGAGAFLVRRKRSC